MEKLRCLNDKLQKVFISSLIANIILLTCLCVLIKYKETLKNKTFKTRSTLHEIHLPHDSGVCIRCDYLGKGIKTNDTLFDKIKTTEDGHRICCTNKPSYLPELIGKMLLTEQDRSKDTENYDELHERLKWWRDRPGSIHMYLDLEKLKDNEFAWIDHDPIGIAFKNGMAVNATSNSIVIPRKARYFVYVAITFDFGDLPSVPIFYHNVTKSHPLLPNTIDTLLMTKYGGSTESDRVYTSFLCGAFEMQGDYNIKTQVSTYEYVSRSKYASYFGMFRI